MLSYMLINDVILSDISKYANYLGGKWIITTLGVDWTM